MRQILLQNPTGKFITKCEKSLLQNTSGCVSQNVTVLLQLATVITKCVDVITKYDSYYKLRSLLQNASVQNPSNIMCLLKNSKI